MKLFSKKDIGYAIVYGAFSLFYGLLLYAQEASIYHSYMMEHLDINLMQMLMLLLWFLPKLLAIVYLAQYFIDTYENCFIYFKIRSRDNNLWVRHVIQSTLCKLFMLTIVKALAIFILLQEIDVIACMYEMLYLLFFIILYMLLYVCIPNAKVTLAMASIQMLTYEIICIMKLNDMRTILFMNDVSIPAVFFVFMSVLCILYVFNYILRKQKYER